MDMVNMKLTKEKREPKGETALTNSEGPEYPYGLSISLDNDGLEKIGIKEMPELGKTMILHAKVEVTNISENQNQREKPHRSLVLQITDMAIEDIKEKKDVTGSLYGESKEEK